MPLAAPCMPNFVNSDSGEFSTVHSALTPEITPLLLKVSIQEDTPIHLQAFLDSGAMGNFIHPRTVIKHKLPTTPRKEPLKLQTVTGKTFTIVTQQVTTTLTTRHGHTENITLDVAPIGRHDLILGLPWYVKHGIQIDWRNKEIIGWSPECESTCFNHIISELQTHPSPLLVKKLSPTTQTPVRATPGSVGYDIQADADITIPPHQRLPIPTGLAIATPEGTYGRIAPRSGLSVKHSINVAAGVIDSDYRGEIKVVLVNHSDLPFQVHKGERVAQLLLERAENPMVVVTDNLDKTESGEGGFGHSGMTTELAEIFAIAMGGQTNIPPIKERYEVLRKIIPEQYHEYLDVFDADRCSSKLAPRRLGYDFEINLIPGAKLPTPA